MRAPKTIFVFLLFAARAFSLPLLSPSSLDGLAEKKQWLRLVHYTHPLLGRWESQATGSDFFLSPRGAEDPEAELLATARAFISGERTPDGKDLAACRFPARFLWLSRELAPRGIALRPPVCPKYWEYRESNSAKSVSLVFSAYYLNNPASAFGHTFLRLNKQDAAYGGHRPELLDHGVNYAAEVTTSNVLLYAAYGLFGFFHGTFTRVPYYYKVREYNDFESRDLWEYDLNMSPEQVEMLEAHIWELGSTYFNYYYLTQNCAYHILTALEAALPETDLVKHLPYVVIPADTVKVIARAPGLIRAIHYRPSLRVQFERRLATLSPKETGALKRVALAGEIGAADSLAPKEKATVLDAALDYVDLHKFKELILEPRGEAGQWKQRLLVARSEVRLPSQTVASVVPAEEAPHLGHEIMRAEAEAGAADTLGPYGAVGFRLALHDLADPAIGYPETSQIEFLNTRLRYGFRARSLWLEDFSFFHVVSLSPFNQFSHPFSWKVNVGATTIRDSSCEHCLAGRAEAGGGFTFRLGKTALCFLTADVEAAFSPRFLQSLMRLGLGPSLGLRLAFSRTLIALASANYRFQYFTPAREVAGGSGEIRWALGPDLALSLKGTRYPDAWESAGGVYYYF